MVRPLPSRPQASHKSPKSKQIYYDDKRLYFEADTLQDD